MPVQVDRIRSSVSLMAGVASSVAGKNKMLSPKELRNFAQYGDSMDQALKALHKETGDTYGVRSPTVSQLDATLGRWMTDIAREAGTGRDGKLLSKKEEGELTTPLKLMVACARDFGDWSLEDVVGEAATTSAGTAGGPTAAQPLSAQKVAKLTAIFQKKLWGDVALPDPYPHQSSVEITGLTGSDASGYEFTFEASNAADDYGPGWHIKAKGYAMKYKGEWLLTPVKATSEDIDRCLQAMADHVLSAFPVGDEFSETEVREFAELARTVSPASPWADVVWPPLDRSVYGLPDPSRPGWIDEGEDLDLSAYPLVISFDAIGTHGSLVGAFNPETGAVMGTNTYGY